MVNIEQSKTADQGQIEKAIESIVVNNGIKGYNALLNAVDKIIKGKIKHRDELIEQAKIATDETAALINGIQKSMESLR